MIEVLINGINVKTEYGLILQSKEIGSPEPKRILVEVPGRDGSLDLTQSVFGKASYLGNRPLKLVFVTDGEDADVFSNAMALWHGKNIEVEFSDDLGWKYKGFCAVSLASAGGHYQTITLECDCEPYQVNGTNRRL